MKEIVIRESLQGGQLPAGLAGRLLRAHPHLLDVATPIEIVELDVDDQQALHDAHLLATALLPSRYYAHVVGDDAMYVAFPNCVALVRKADPQTASQAQAIGGLYDIPLSQMRFLEMFDTDHPDAPDADADQVA
jgi:hypothetical protein